MGLNASKGRNVEPSQGPPKGDIFTSSQLNPNTNRYSACEANKSRYHDKGALVNQASYSSYILSREANNRSNFLSSLARPYSRPLPQTETPKPIPALNLPCPSIASFKEFNSSWQTYRLGKQDYTGYTNRISQNVAVKEEEEKVLRAQREQERAETKSKWYDKTESWLPQSTLSSTIDLTDRFKQLKQLDLKYFKPKPERPELTPEMLARIEHASKPYPPDEYLSEIDGVQLTRKDIRTLTGLNWLNDEIINAYMHLLVVRSKQPKFSKVYAFNTFFYPKIRETGYNSVKRWTRKVDVFSFDYLLVPVHLGNHWCLALIDLAGKMISYYDSMGGTPHGCCDTLLDYLRYELKDKKKQELDDENWRLIDKCNEDESLPRQHNCSDCGVFACIYAEYLTRGAKMNFEQKHMPYFRKKMIYELLTKTILE